MNLFFFNGNLEKLIENGNRNSYTQMVGKVTNTLQRDLSLLLDKVSRQILGKPTDSG